MKSQLTVFAIKLKKEMESNGNISCGLYDLLCDMSEDSTLNELSTNKATIDYITSRACDNALNCLKELIDLYHEMRRKKIANKSK